MTTLSTRKLIYEDSVHHTSNSDDIFKVMVQIDYTPKGFMAGLGDALGAVKLQIRNDLQCFKEFLETRGSETGEWRGSVAQH